MSTNDPLDAKAVRISFQPEQKPDKPTPPSGGPVPSPATEETPPPMEHPKPVAAKKTAKKTAAGKADRRVGPRLTEDDLKAALEEQAAALEAKFAAQLAALQKPAQGQPATAATEATPSFESLVRMPRESVQQQLSDGEVSDPHPSEPGVVFVHFVADGLTALGKVWVRGEELTVKEGTQEWEALSGRDGRMVLTYDEDEQIARWGERKFRPGPWRGQGWTVPDDMDLTREERQAMERAELRRRQHAAMPGTA